MDAFTSRSGADWKQVSTSPWNATDPINYLNVDNDVWRFAPLVD